MNHYPNQDRGLHSRRSAIELPYPGDRSPPQSNIAARQYKEPNLHRAESIASYHSHQSRQGRERFDQRPMTPPADPPTPPMSRQGSFNLNDQLYPSHVPQQHYHYDPKDYPEHDNSSINLTPPSSADTTFKDQYPLPDNARPARGGTNAYTERVLNPVTGYLNKVTCDSSDSGYEVVEYYDPQGRLTDASGTVIIHELEHVPHGSQDRDFDHHDEMIRRHHGHTKFIDTPTASQQFEAYDLEERHPPTRVDGDQTPRQSSPISPRTKYRDDRDTKQSYTATLRKGDDRVSRLGHQVQENRDTRYGPSMSTATVKYAKKDRVSNLKPPRQVLADRSAQFHKRDASPAQSVSSLGSRRSAYSYQAKDQHRALRTYKQESSESSRRFLSPVKRDRMQKNQSMTTRDRSLSPVEPYQSHKHESERSRRSISPPRRDDGRRDIQTRSPDYSSSGSESDYSTPRRSKSGDSNVIMMMFSSKSRSKTSRSKDSDDSWDKETFSGPSPVGRTLYPPERARRERVQTRAEMASAFRRLADRIERESDDETKMRVFNLSD